MTKVYVIRHAEAEGNLYRRMHGWYNSAVTELGKRQLTALAERFAGIRLDAVFSSDLSRAYLTAQAAASGSGVPVVKTERLREFNLGRWEDHTWGEAAEYDRQQLADFNNDPARWHVDGSETLSEVQERMLSALREYSAGNDGKTIALVSHGAAIRAMLAAILNIPSEEITKIQHCDNTAVAELTVNNETGEITVNYMGDNSHLASVGSSFQRQSWWKKRMDYDVTSMRFVPLSETDREIYALTGGNFETALKRGKSNGRYAVWALYDGEKAGYIELDAEREESLGIGWIDIYYMLEVRRGMRLSVQLLGHAVSVYRGLGRGRIRIRADGSAAEYFKQYGFYALDENTLEKDISV